MQGTRTSWEEVQNSPHFLVRVRPGDLYTVLASVRNTGPLPIRLLGLNSVDIVYGSGNSLDDYLIGLALPTDPSSTVASGAIPFHPVDIPPGQYVTVVIAGIGGECADPTADIPPNDANHWTVRQFLFVFEVLGWRRVSDLWPQFDLTVASRPGCERVQ